MKHNACCCARFTARDRRLRTMCASDFSARRNSRDSGSKFQMARAPARRRRYGFRMTMARGQRAERLGRFRGGSEASRGSLRLVEGFLKRRLRADSCGFADELGLLLLHGLPGREDHFFAGDFVEIAFDAFLILRGDALEFAMDVGVLGGFGGPVFLEILPLVGLVGIDGGL